MPVADADRIERLQKEHREIDRRIHEIERHVALTPEEQAELPRLKKLRLAKKDQLQVLGRGHT